MSIVADNKVKRELIVNGKRQIGCMLIEIRQPSVLIPLANGGLNFVIIDNEHGPFSIETIADVSRAAKYYGLSPFVRVPDNSYTEISKALDAGAQGIMIPRITNRKQVEDVVQIMKYPPWGIRGSAQNRGYTNFKVGNVEEVMSKVNTECLLIVQIETSDAITNLDQILTVKGVDIALIGPNDLSISLGVAGQKTSPILIDAIDKTIGACKRHNVIPGIHVNDLDSALYWSKRGMQFISNGSEMDYISKTAKDMTTAFELLDKQST